MHQIHTLKSNNSTVAKFDYAYDNNGRRTSVLEADGSRVTWTYDGTSQVTSEWRTGTSPFRHTFVYDTRGNRTLKNEDGARTTLVYDAANQLSSSADVGGTTSYTYDANGNQHLTVAPGGLRTTQIWDYENRLVKTLQPGGGVFTMAYDADGLRVRKETPSETKLFVWMTRTIWAQADDSGVTEVAYTTEPSTYGSTISHRSGGATTTYHFDALAAARALTNASETVMESYNYTAFGTILGSPSLLTPFLWAGWSDTTGTPTSPPNTSGLGITNPASPDGSASTPSVSRAEIPTCSGTSGIHRLRAHLNSVCGSQHPHMVNRDSFPPPFC
ncbi:MAG: hypothetical protein U0929_17435 [Planctomycetaceae bacterium]